MTTQSYVDFDEARIKHLEMIQAVISRLGNDSFLVKGWALTVAGAFFGFAINGANPGLALVSLISTILFWTVDVHFLRAERLFRVLFDYARKAEVEPFFMGATSDVFVARVCSDVKHKDVASWRATYMRPTLRILYGLLIGVAVLLAILIASQATVLQPHPLPTPSPSASP